MRFLTLLTLALLVSACGSQARERKASQPADTEQAASTGPAPRQPTARERADIAVAVRSVWEYESHLSVWAQRLHVRPRHLRPVVVGVRVSGTGPHWASAVVELRNARGQRRPGTAILVFRNVPKAREPDAEYAAFDGPWQIEHGPATEFPGACASSTPKALKKLLCPNPWSVLNYPRPRDSHPSYRYSIPISSSDLHALDWKSVSLPGAACGAAQPIPLHRHSGYTHSVVDPWWGVIFVNTFSPVYGDLNGDGKDEAAVAVFCANDGGTAAGQLSAPDVVFAAVGKSLRVVGIIWPRQPFAADITHIPMVSVTAIRRGEVIAGETWYGPHDGTCCASGRAKTIWAYRNGKLTPKRTIVLRKPSQS